MQSCRKPNITCGKARRDALLKLINRYYKILWLKSTSIFKEQARIPLKLNIEKTSCRQKRITIEQLLQDSVHTNMKSTKGAIFQQKKTQNQSIRGQITFGIQLQTFPSECNTRKLQSKT